MDKHIEEFVRVMEQKGYRDLFRVCEDEFSARKREPRFLKDCLEKYLNEALKKKEEPGTLYLAHDFYSARHRQDMECRFTLSYSAERGFAVTSMRAKLDVSGDVQRMPIRASREIPGYQMIEGLFKKKQPWDDLKRGRFR